MATCVMTREDGGVYDEMVVVTERAVRLGKRNTVVVARAGVIRSK